MRSIAAIAKSKNGVPVRLTEERREHIVAFHVDMDNNQLTRHRR
jgi:hypothetical protein